MGMVSPDMVMCWNTPDTAPTLAETPRTSVTASVNEYNTWAAARE
jgi:hypothetical protein